jgi:putative ABC transport system permease protein
MFKNYLKIAFRNIVRHKGYSFINIAGLSIGTACCIVILLYIVAELNYDKYHVDKDRIFRVSQVEKTENHTSIDPVTAPPLAPALKANFPEVEIAARILPVNRRIVKYKDKTFYEGSVMYADQDIFNILTIPFLEGDRENSLNRPGTMVISKRTAEKYFGEESPINKTIQVNNREFEITGVAANSPENTHMKYDLIAALKFEEEPAYLSNWMRHAIYSYIKLAPNVDIERFEKKMCRIGDKYAKETFDKMGYTYTFFLQAVPDLHLYPCPHGEPEPPGDPLRLYIFAAVGVLILLIACFNFMNLTTARSASRAKEIGIRKVTGARRIQLIRQFLSESFLMAFLAIFLALILVEISMPFIKNLTGMTFTSKDILRHGMPVLIFGLLLIVGFVSGSYPAFILSRFKPVLTLKGHSYKKSGCTVRKILVVGQFTISIILIIAALMVKQQLDFMKNRNLGFEKEQKLVLPVRGNASIEKNYESVKNEFLKHHGISTASVSSQVPGQDLSSWYTKLMGEDDEKSQSIGYLFFDRDFISHFNIKLIAGRDFRKTDSKEVFIINESALTAFGWNSPEQAVGKQIGTGFRMKGPIVGVTKNFHYQGLQNAVAPLIMAKIPLTFNKIILTVDTENLEETLAFVKKKWQELFPGNPLEYFFLDDNFNRQYRAEEQIGSMMAVFTLLGLFIACLGLFGLAAFMAEQRTKEIGIRKILGSSVPEIVLLLSREFTKWVLLANIIAWPVAYYVVNKWLQHFAYRTPLGIGTLILAAVITLLIAWLTVSYQSIKAATANPVEALRYE